MAMLLCLLDLASTRKDERLTWPWCWLYTKMGDLSADYYYTIKLPGGGIGRK